MDPEECRELQAQEMEALHAIYQGEEFRVYRQEPPMFQIRLKGEYEIESEELALGFCLGPRYPYQPPQLWVERGTLPRAQEAALVEHLQAVGHDAAGQPMVYSLVAAAEEFCAAAPVPVDVDVDAAPPYPYQDLVLGPS